MCKMRKNSIFHRIPSGEWGLLSWFPNAKIEKDDDDSNGSNGTTTKKSERASEVAPQPMAAVPPIQPEATVQAGSAQVTKSPKKKKEKSEDAAGTETTATATTNEQAASAT